MKHLSIALLTLLVASTSSFAQPQGGFRRESFPEGSYSPVTNINRNSYPRVLADNSVMFRVQAPQAQTVQIDLGGTKYDMTKAEGGQWTVTTSPQVPGFHYYNLVLSITIREILASARRALRYSRILLSSSSVSP